MAGILNSKERVIDFIITKQGRRQMSDGRLLVEYASFTDLHTFYEPSGSDHPDVAEDPSNRIFFEASDRHQDIIVPELDAGYSMQSFRTENFSIEGFAIASGTFPLGTSVETTKLSGSAIVAAAGSFLTDITKNFQDQRILETEDLFSPTTGFRLSAHTASFVVTKDDIDFYQGMPGTADPDGQATIDLNNHPSIAASDRFDHLPNFKYMPPINVKDKATDPDVPLGKYPELGFSSDNGRFSSLTGTMQYLSGKQSLSFDFAETSNQNNIVSQVFEMNNPSNKQIEKLSIVDYGEFQGETEGLPGKHVYFVGRIREDSQGAQTFLNLFTVVFE